MPNKPISIEFTSDTDKYEKGLKDAARATGKFADTLETEVPRASEKMADRAERDFERIGDEAKEAGRETGKNFVGSLGEGLGSGDLSEVVQETLGEAVSGMSGPVGAAVGIIAGGALLLFNQVKKGWEETNAAILAQTESMWSTVMDSITGSIGGAFAKVNAETLVLTELHRLWESEPEGMQKLVNSAEALGISAWDITRARAGDVQAIARVKGAMDEVYELQNSTNDATADQIKAVQDIESALYRSETAWQKNDAQVRAYNQSVSTLRTDIAGVIAMTEQTYPLKVRAQMDASQLHQLFPYGVGGGTSSGGKVYAGTAGASG